MWKGRLFSERKKRVELTLLLTLTEDEKSELSWSLRLRAHHKESRAEERHSMRFLTRIELPNEQQGCFYLSHPRGNNCSLTQTPCVLIPNLKRHDFDFGPGLIDWWMFYNVSWTSLDLSCSQGFRLEFWICWMFCCFLCLHSHFF